MLFQGPDALAPDFRVGVTETHHNLPYPAFYNGIGARRGAPLVTTRFQIEDHAPSPGPASGLAQCFNLRMRFSRLTVISFTNHLALVGDHSPHHRIGRSSALPFPGKIQSTAH